MEVGSFETVYVFLTFFERAFAFDEACSFQARVDVMRSLTSIEKAFSPLPAKELRALQQRLPLVYRLIPCAPS